MLFKIKGWLYNGWKDDLTEEVYEITEVVSEIGEKLYSRLMESIWDIGEIMISKKKKERAKDWKTWKSAAEELDKIQGKDEWKKREQSPLYDYRLLRRRLKLIQNMQEVNDVEALVHHLRSGLLRGLGGNLHPELYSKCLVDTKYLIIDYQKEVRKAFHYVLNSENFRHELTI